MTIVIYETQLTKEEIAERNARPEVIALKKAQDELYRFEREVIAKADELTEELDKTWLNLIDRVNVALRAFH